MGYKEFSFEKNFARLLALWDAAPADRPSFGLWKAGRFIGPAYPAFYFSAIKCRLSHLAPVDS